MGEREIDNSMPGEKVAGQKLTEGNQRKSYSELVIEGMRKRGMVYVWDSIVRKTFRVSNKEDDVGQGWICFSSRRDK